VQSAGPPATVVLQVVFQQTLGAAAVMSFANFMPFFN
jgi:hypothetical protein